MKKIISTSHILHVDMDAFFVSAELVRKPELVGKPVVVGGSGRRGVVAAASYEARSYGIHSAMPSFRARKLCPKAVFLPGDHTYYASISYKVMEIFKRYTPIVEPISLDEAFLDVGGSQRLYGTPFEIADSIRNDVKQEQGLNCSVGIAPNKFLAKLATEEAKPKPSPNGPIPGIGIKTVHPDGIFDFLDPLPIRALWGVGPATAKRLDQLGIASVLDLRKFPLVDLVNSLGKSQGAHLHRLSHGIDERNVKSSQITKSISHEETFADDLFDLAKIESEIHRMSDAVGKRLRSSKCLAKTVNLKIRLKDFSTFVRSVTLPNPTDSGKVISREAIRLINTVDISIGVRLIGVGVTNFNENKAGQQLSFDELETNDRDWREAEDAMDSIRSRFGPDSIGAASTLTNDGVSTKKRGIQQWGPSN
ncbi:MAG: DNA polymerase IV [Actinomycetota bacterium]